MSLYYLKIELKSDATFGRGDGIAGLVDVEVEQDSLGLPYLRGRSLKGLWREECENLIAVHPYGTALKAECDTLFGVGGSTTAASGLLQVGDALLPDAVRVVAQQAQLKPHEILASLTGVRRQTAIDDVGIADAHSLRAMRVILRTTPFISMITCPTLTSAQEAVLVAGCYALRHLGTSRNRGRGEVQCRLFDQQGSPLNPLRLHQFTEKPA
ncbi:RAMP superfamily CRISPR-associated protein [Herpetosiphon giganteus]|uniref:RAMP superfamily CRISPR-associated protein n=1 Tax=Herpetosiphon giganteus TaxID=2029754 RepID=UPI00195CBA46|nr:RAMP superfamily CRISPR-associated protein [Herpetosiphon giganteus]MBM7844804.1 CRISPR/Cas system CSM-associated protein Csm3 (group 7 of RAMP superfamily) [Herpetosiphon giganteus]